jgi:hypothetical protein
MGHLRRRVAAEITDAGDMFYHFFRERLGRHDWTVLRGKIPVVPILAVETIKAAGTVEYC